MQFHEREKIDLFNFTSFFAWIFFNFLARCDVPRIFRSVLGIILKLKHDKFPSILKDSSCDDGWGKGPWRKILDLLNIDIWKSGIFNNCISAVCLRAASVQWTHRILEKYEIEFSDISSFPGSPRQAFF